VDYRPRRQCRRDPDGFVDAEQGGIEALAAVKARAPDLPVLIFSGFPESQYATTVLRQGACGYLPKDCEPEEIVTANPIRRARPPVHHAAGRRVAG
jgi:DNA-binding NarL/FixJ family response regulator